MKMNAIETIMMNNPIRRIIQKHHATPIMLELGGQLDGGHFLEIGCGHGYGTRLILEAFGADTVDAFDLDPQLVKKATTNLKRHGDRVNIWSGSVTEIKAPDNTYNAVVGFGIIHHLPDWRLGLSEVHRVLKPGGIFYSEESFAPFINHPFWRRVLEHPREARFDATQYIDAVAEHHMDILGTEIASHGGYGWVCAQKPNTPTIMASSAP